MEKNNQITLKVDDVEIVIKDLDDPGVMDEINYYIGLVKDSSKEFIEQLISELPRMHVTWNAPWYQETLSFTKPLTEVQEGQEPFRTDKFSKQEGDQVDKNWKKLVKMFDLPNKPVCFARWRSTSTGRGHGSPIEKARRFVMMYLARNLERTLYQVHKHFQKKHLYLATGVYTKTEQKIAKVVYEHVADPVPILSLLLDRNPRGLYVLLKSFSATEPKKMIERQKWTLEMSDKLFRCLLNYSQLSKEQLKYNRLSHEVWLQVEKDFNIPYSSIKYHWTRKLHTQIFVEKDIKLNKTRKLIIKRLRELPYQVWTDINWRELVSFFPDGCTAEFLYYTFVPLLRKHRNAYTKLPISEVLDMATDMLMSQNSSPGNKRLRRFRVNEKNHLEPIKYNTS